LLDAVALGAEQDGVGALADLEDGVGLHEVFELGCIYRSKLNTHYGAT
jgi:hypothetical protein